MTAYSSFFLSSPDTFDISLYTPYGARYWVDYEVQISSESQKKLKNFFIENIFAEKNDLAYLENVRNDYVLVSIEARNVNFDDYYFLWELKIVKPQFIENFQQVEELLHVQKVPVFSHILVE